MFDSIKCDCVTIACLLNIANTHIHTHISSYLKELPFHFYKFVYKYKTNYSQVVSVGKWKGKFVPKSRNSLAFPCTIDIHFQKTYLFVSLSHSLLLRCAC